uniref:Transcription factor znf27 n=1 Tax=Aspergillus flavus (strain ATCC 200026 / FGSC A1120 / IAM 13836 / NRRL 3357 / JCM 12722 / SRRC 167) TaxID=332952 RepID=ZNF27_ASPFN|nr:RecName: Full=Transcription factor znf27; AltName: Full=Asparasone A synthesis protein znf27 [Aspergillus flavus NRRL3357]
MTSQWKCPAKDQSLRNIQRNRRRLGDSGLPATVVRCSKSGATRRNPAVNDASQCSSIVSTVRIGGKDGRHQPKLQSRVLIFELEDKSLSTE